MDSHKLAEVLLAGPNVPVVIRHPYLGPTEVMRVEDRDADFWSDCGKHVEAPHVILDVVPRKHPRHA